MSEELADAYLAKHGRAQWKAGDNPPWVKEGPVREEARPVTRQLLVEDAEPISERLRRPFRRRPRYRITRPTGFSLGPSLKTMCRTEETEADVAANHEAIREMIGASIAGDREGLAELVAEVMGRKVQVAIGGCRDFVGQQMAVELEEREGD